MDVVAMTSELISFNSSSQRSNLEITDYLERSLRALEFEVERLEYRDDHDVPKASLVAKKGTGTGGLALLSHSDTVPAEGWDHDPFRAVIRDGCLSGRGSCDMKGPLAATIAAAARFRPAELRHPLYIVVTADEEIGGVGAQSVARDSVLFNGAGLRYGVIAEPTRLAPVYAHKGGARLTITARGRAAHSSTVEGINANFLIAAFLAEMAELHRLFQSDERYMNRAFDPPTNGWNMIIDNGNTPANVTAARSVCTISFRPMPGDPSDEIIEMVREKAAKYGLEFTASKRDPFMAPRDSAVVVAALAATERSEPGTVAFGTDAFAFAEKLEMVILGPGDIRQAHTVGEWISLPQLQQAVEIYARIIPRFCMGNGG